MSCMWDRYVLSDSMYMEEMTDILYTEEWYYCDGCETSALVEQYYKAYKYRIDHTENINDDMEVNNK